MMTGLQLKPDGEIETYSLGGDTTEYKILLGELKELLQPLTKTFKKIFSIKNKIPKHYEKILKSNSEPVLMKAYKLNGSLFFVRYKDFERVNFFDERVFMYFEEDILATKIKKLGRSVGIYSGVTFTHYHNVAIDRYGEKFWKNMKLDKIFNRSAIFFFNNYMTSNKLLQMFYASLRWFNFYKDFVLVKLPLKFFHTLKSK